MLPVINASSVHNIIATVHAGQPADMPCPGVANDVSDTHVMTAQTLFREPVLVQQHSG